MRRFLFAIAGIAIATTMTATTLRVNNVKGSGAMYTTFEEAHDAAEDGDVIIVDGSPDSYGKITISKCITVQGPGYFLDVNGQTNEGYSPATFDEVDLSCNGAKVTGIYVDGNINMRANNLIVTRCRVYRISLCAEYSFTEDHITQGIIHQNYIINGIYGDSYSASASYMQVTNNIIADGYNTMLCNMDNSVISRNTALSNEAGVRNLTNCVIENNISYNIESDYYNNKDNTYSNNYNFDVYNMVNELYGSSSKRTDLSIMEVDATLGSDKGAFSGDDPYVLSGLSSGPFIQDIEMPESVVQGEELKITIKIGSSR